MAESNITARTLDPGLVRNLNPSTNASKMSTPLPSTYAPKLGADDASLAVESVVWLEEWPTRDRQRYSPHGGSSEDHEPGEAALHGGDEFCSPTDQQTAVTLGWYRKDG